MAIRSRALRTFPRPVLCWVLDGAAIGACGEEGLVRALRAGVDWLQVRDRTLEGRALLAAVDRACAAARRAGAPARVLVNRRVDAALAAGADGAHLGGDALPLDAARRLLGAEAWIGVSTHDPDEVLAASGASYAHLAPVFPPLSKAAQRPPLGPDALRRAAGADVPVLAQGGIEPSNARDVLRAGAAGVAVTGAIDSRDPEPGARALREALDAR